MYQYKTQPFAHQRQESDQHWQDVARGLLWEMGCGKSKATIDEAAQLYHAGKIDCILIVAPDGVHRNWITDEVPIHMPDDVLAKSRLFCYRTDKAGTKWHQKEAEEALVHPGLLVVAMSYDAVTTEPITKKNEANGKRVTIWRGGKKYLWDLLSKRKCVYVADEARRIKNPLAERSKVVVKSAKFAPYRRLLNGTPVPNGPFDLYSQMCFLDENFWKPHGIATWTAYKSFFGVFEPAKVRGPGGVLREFQQLMDYKNLDMLQRFLGTICSRVTKDQVLNLPPKLYSRRVFDLNAAQDRVYQQLASDFMATLDTGEFVAAPLALTRLLRFQQVTSGFVPVESTDPEAEPIADLGTSNPRLDLLKEICEDVPHKAIIWCRFNRTVDKVMAMLGKDAVRYDGQVTADAREQAKQDFQKGNAQWFVAKAQSAGEGLTLHAARTVIYVENTFDLAMRLQSEDRAHRIGQEHPVNYIDLIAQGTVDDHIVKALLEKMDVANQITGDRVKQWLLSA